MDEDSLKALAVGRTPPFLRGMPASQSGPPLVERAASHGTRTAITDAAAEHTYQELLDASARVASRLLGERSDLDEARIAFFVAPGFEHVAVQWGIWRAGGIAVPLALSYPPAELEYVIRDAEASAVVADAGAAGTLRPLAAAAVHSFSPSPRRSRRNLYRFPLSRRTVAP